MATCDSSIDDKIDDLLCMVTTRSMSRNRTQEVDAPSELNLLSVTREELASLQRSDPDISPIIQLKSCKISVLKPLDSTGAACLLRIGSCIDFCQYLERMIRCKSFCQDL